MPTDNQPSLDSSVFCFDGVPEDAFEAMKYCFRTNKPKVIEPVEGQSLRKFEGVAFSGEPIIDHWFWDSVIFDLDSTVLADETGTLINHDDDRRCGVVTEHIKDYQTGLTVSGHLLSNQYGQEVAKDSDDGYPWQMSVRIFPGSVQEYNGNQTVDINGKTYQGPITVFRNNRIREISFCAVGADDKTFAKAFQAFKAKNKPNTFKSTSEENDMDLVAAQARINELETENTQLQEQNKQFAADKRKAEIAALGKDLGKEFSADDVKDMLELEDKAFAFSAKQAREIHKQFSAGKPNDNLPRILFTEQATGGKQFSADKPSLAERAKDF